MKARLRFLHHSLVRALAYVWRRLLFRTTFIAITGSVGKTTAKQCLAAILSAAAPTAATLNNQNDRRGVPRTLLRVRPWHRFAVIELAMVEPGLVRRSARLVRPHVAIVLAIARTHLVAYSSREEIAAEKAALLDALTPGGLAILNADDARVLAMASGRRCRVKTFGLTPGQDVWADAVSAAFPETLTLRVHTASEAEWVKTQLVGRHWAGSVMAALCAALACGISLKAAAAAIAGVEPFPGRMQPVELPGGAIMIRDEMSGSFDTWQAATDVLREARAARRVLVAGDFSDWPARSQRSTDRNRELGRMAAGVADVAAFVSEHVRHAIAGAVAAGMPAGAVHGFSNPRAAADWLRSELRAGDVVLLKGRNSDHLSRICFAQFGEIGCWKPRCGKRILCDHCDELRPGFDLQSSGRAVAAQRARPELEQEPGR